MMRDLDRELAAVLKFLPGWKLDPDLRSKGISDSARSGTTIEPSG
jgi:hypothetical protein